MTNWTLKRQRTEEGETLEEVRTLTDWFIEGSGSLVRTRGSLIRDKVVLVQYLNFDDAEDFRNGDLIRIYRKEVQWFVGRVLKPMVQASAQSERRVTTVAGPWWYAENRMALADWTGNDTFETLVLPRLLLCSVVQGTPPTIASEIISLITRLTALGAPMAVGDIDVRGTPPPQIVENVTTAEAIRLGLQSLPDAVAWFDYSAETPTFNVRDPERLEPVTIDVGAGVNVAAWDAARHDDDAVPYVEIIRRFEQEFEIEDDVAYRVHYERHRWPGNAANDFGGLELVLKATDVTDRWEAIGFARRAFEAFAGIRYRASLELVGQDVTDAVTLGMRLNFSGAAEELATMNAIVQQTEDDVFAGRTTVTAGPPLQLGFSDLVQKLMALRRKPPGPDDVKEQGEGWRFAPADEAAKEQGEGSVKIVVAELASGSMEPRTCTIRKAKMGAFP